MDKPQGQEKDTSSPARDVEKNTSESNTSMGVLPRIRTYAQDMNNVIKARGETLSSIVNAEKTNPKEDPKPEKKNQGQKKRILLLVSAFVFFILGIGAVAGVTFFVNQEEKEIAELSPGIIFANRTATIARDDSVIADLATLRQDTDMSLGEVLRVVVTEGSFEASPTTVAQALNLPPLLVREIVDVMIGVHAFDRNQPFIILKVRMFDRSFNALLDTERTLGEALGDFFAPLNAASNAPKLTFRDTIINNIDTRRSQDAWPIIYAYPSRDTLIITTNEFTLREVVMRLNQ